MRAILRGMFLLIPGLAGAQPAAIEATIGLSVFAPDTVGIDIGQLGGDNRDDLLLRRAAADGDFAEIWLREDNLGGGYTLGQPLPGGAVRGQAVTDIDFDGDADIVIATADAHDAVVVWINRGNVEPKFERSPQRHRYAGVTSLAASYFRDTAAAPPFRAGVLLTRNGAPDIALRYDGAGGLVELPQDFPHPGGAVAMTSLVGDLAGPGYDHMSFGAPPQRLWLSTTTNFAYTERVVDEITSTLVAALCTDLDHDGDSDLIVATAANTIEVWINQGGEFTQRQSFAVANAASIQALSLFDLDAAPAPGHADLAVGHTTNAPASVRRTTLYRYDGGTGLFAARDDELPHGAALASRGAGAAARLFIGQRDGGLRIFQPRTAPFDPVAVRFEQPKMRAVENRYLSILLPASAPLPVRATVPIPPTTGYFLPGGAVGYVDIPPRPAGTYNYAMLTPDPPSITVGQPGVVEVLVLPRIDPNNVCATDCLMTGRCGHAARSGPHAKGGGDFMGTDAQVQTLRDFRDMILRDSPKGAEYEAIYERFEGELYTVTLLSPTFYFDLAAAKDAWMPALESLVAGDADTVITADMADAMDEVFDHFRSRGSRALRAVIEEQYAQLSPRDYVGQTIDALRDDWEALPPTTVFENGFETP